MKKLFIPLICFLLLAFVSSTSGFIFVRGGGSGAVAAYCNACPGTDSDMVCEEFETASTCTIAAGDVDVGNTLDESAALSGTPKCSDQDNDGLDFMAGNGGENANVTIDVSDGLTSVYGKFYFILVSEDMDDASEYIAMVSLRKTGGSPGYITLQEGTASGEYHLHLRYKDDGAAYASAFGTASEITLGQWHQVEFTWIQNSQWTINLDGVQTINVTGDGALDDTAAVDFIELGSDANTSAIGASDDTNIQIDNLKLDDDAMPGDCAGWTD